MNQLGNIHFPTYVCVLHKRAPLHTIGLFGNAGSHCNIDLSSKAHQLQSIHVVRIVSALSVVRLTLLCCAVNPQIVTIMALLVCTTVFSCIRMLVTWCLFSWFYLPLLTCLAMWVGHYIGHVCEASWECQILPIDNTFWVFEFFKVCSLHSSSPKSKCWPAW